MHHLQYNPTKINSWLLRRMASRRQSDNNQNAPRNIWESGVSTSSAACGVLSVSNTAFPYWFRLDAWSTDDGGALRSPTMTVLLSIPPFTAVRICLAYWGVPVLGACIIYDCHTFLGWSFDHYVASFVSVSLILPGMSTGPPAFFWFPSAQNTFFRSFTFSLCAPLDLKWFSYRQRT